MQSIEKFLEQRKKVAKTYISYFNEEHNMVDKKDGKYFIITEYDKDGKLLNSIHGEYENEKKKENKEER